MSDQKISTAWAPGHITGFFSPSQKNSDPLLTGSCGAGFSLQTGLITSVCASTENIILFNNAILGNPLVSSTVRDLFFKKTSISTVVKIEHNTELPSGSGLGTSGAGALSLSLALNSFFGRPISDLEASQIAHEAEIICKTGLGTVIADTTSGFEARIKAGGPGFGEILSFPALNFHAIIAVAGPLSTGKMLAESSFQSRAEKISSELMQTYLSHPVPDVFFSCAQEFSISMNLFTPRLSALKKSLAERGILSSMLFFGEGLFTLTSENSALATLKIFQDSCEKSGLNKAIVFHSALSTIGATLLNA